MKYFSALIFLFFSHSLFAENIYPVQINQCISKDCFGLREGDMYEPGYTINGNIKVNAWLDIVTLGEEKSASFFPLFNVFNKTDSPINIELGMQFLNANEEVVISIISDYTVNPYTGSGDPNQETFYSLNAKPISKDQIQDSKFLKVIYKLK